MLLSKLTRRYQLDYTVKYHVTGLIIVCLDEHQVFVGGLPVDVTSTLFRTWADEVFTGHVINAVLVRYFCTI